MSLSINGYNIFLIVIISFISSVVLVPIVKKISYHIGALDYPNARKVHKVPMPSMGGLAIFLAFLLGYIIFAQNSIQIVSILIGSFIIVLEGIVDDVNPLKARYKLLMQVVAALIIVFYGKIVLNSVSILGFNMTFPEPLNYFFTVLFVVGVTNAVNLIDGLDGLAAGISSIYFATIAIIALIVGSATGLDVMLSLIMLGATLGFLVYNFPPAIIFMGDTGSQFLGFIISVIALLGFKTATFTSLLIPIAILAIPLLDTALAILRRLIKRQPIGYPDKDHLHHQLLKMNLSVKKTLLIIYVIDIAFAAISVFYTLNDPKIAMAIYIVLMIATLVLILKTNILVNHDKNKKTH